MNIIESIIIAFSMFSKIPVPFIEWNKKNMRFMMCCFPFVGFAIILADFVIYLFHYLNIFHFHSDFIFPLFFVLAPVIVTGGIHIDGFMDTSDALASHASKDKKLEILKDSHCGAFSVINCVLYFLTFFIIAVDFFKIYFPLKTNYDLLYTLRFSLVFMISRFFSALAVATFPIAKDSGLVHTFSDSSAKKITKIWSLLWLALIFSALFYFDLKTGLAIFTSSSAVFVYYFFMSKKEFGGITGDLAGWFVQVCELFCFISIVFAGALK